MSHTQYHWHQPVCDSKSSPPSKCWETKAEAVLTFLPDDMTGLSLLDMGCAEGYFCLAAHRRNAARVVGIDISSEMIEKAEFILGSLGIEEGISYTVGDICCDIDSVQVGKDKFDFIICVDVLEHTSNPLEVLKQMRRHGKTIIVGVPNLWYLWNLFKEPDPTSGHLWAFSPLSFQALVREAGFQVFERTGDFSPTIIFKAKAAEGPSDSSSLAEACSGGVSSDQVYIAAQEDIVSGIKRIVSFVTHFVFAAVELGLWKLWRRCVRT